MLNAKRFSFMDRVCLGIDQALRTLTNEPKTSGAAYPADGVAEAELTDQEKQEVAALMRINHAGEICAQGLYHGQSAVSKSRHTEIKMQQAAVEEGDHLKWCQYRIDELGSHSSYLSPLWYAGSFCIGAIAGIVGDDWSLGFVVETEKQVIRHLESHMAKLPSQDERSYKILKKMEEDEAHHRDEAIAEGARELPAYIKKTMAFTSKIMVNTTYYV